LSGALGDLKEKVGPKLKDSVAELHDTAQDVVLGLSTLRENLAEYQAATAIQRDDDDERDPPLAVS
jgi:hypothetical protein